MTERPAIVRRLIPRLDGDFPGPLGRHVHHDQRSRAFAMPAPVAPDSQRIDWRQVESRCWTRMLPVDNQGDVGDCTAEALYGLLSYPANGITHPSPHTQADCRALYSDATKLDDIAGTYPPDDTGSSGLAVCKAAMARGLISSYRHAFDLSALLLGISRDGPAMVGTNWYTGMDRPDRNNQIHPAGAIRGGHEYVLDSVDLVLRPDGNIDLRRTMIGMCQSWGLSWGNQGRALLCAGDLAMLLKQDGDATFIHVGA